MDLSIARTRAPRHAWMLALGEMNEPVTRVPSRWAVVALATAVLLGGLQAVPAHAYPRPGMTQRVNVASDGTQGMAAPGDHPATANSGFPTVSGDGRLVAFASGAPNLVAGDTNGEWDVFVHDRVTGTTERVSVAADGTEANGQSTTPSLSADGRFVAFASQAPNLVAGDTNDRWDVFVHDRAAGTTERVSVASDGTEGNGNTIGIPAIAPDGSLVAFSSLASNLVAGDTNSAQDIFVHDRAGGTTERVSVASNGSQSNRSSWGPAITADGNFVAFSSAASNLDPGDTGELEDVYVHDRAAGTTQLVSVSIHGGNGNNNNLGLTNTIRPAISADGRFVAFPSAANDLVPVDTNSRWDVFVRDRVAGTTERVSVGSDGTQGNDNAMSAAISADGRFVVFTSFASNLVPGDTNAVGDAFVHDRDTGATELVSVASDGTQADGHISGNLATSTDGSVVAFRGPAANLVAGDTNGASDVFARVRGATLGVGALATEPTADGVRVSGRASFSGAGMTHASDPDDDGGSVGQTAADLGAELTGASVVSRPETEDLLIRWRLANFPLTSPPQARLVGSIPGIVYGLGFAVDGARFEVRGLRAAPTNREAPFARAALYRCEAQCVQQASLTGSFGSVGDEVWVSLPLAALPVSEGAEVSSLRAFTAIGETAVGAVEELDDIVLPAADIPAIRVEVGIAPASTAEGDVAFEHLADLAEGRFSADVPTAQLPAGDYRLWARACLGETCAPAASAESSL